ncbi:MAG: hypothetical protein WBV06_03825 [Acidimicrobiia bacterium]
MKRYRPQILLLIGAAITMMSILWELVRMNPQTSYLVDPWSRRGYQSVHGSLIFTIGGLILIFGLLTFFNSSLKPLWSRLIALVMALGAVVVAMLYGGSESAMGGGMVGSVVALLGAFVVMNLVDTLLPELSSSIRLLIGSVTFIVAFFVLELVLGTSHSAKPWVWIAVASVIAFGIAATGKHPQLSANRMLMLMTLFGWVAIAVSAAVARTSLVTAQVERSIAETGAPLFGDYKDVQVTSGYFLALFGMMVAFVASVSLWAKRRDIIINQERAERQRAAAEASAAEIKTALEIAQRHQREARAAQ